jgi:hypothetical protein
MNQEQARQDLEYVIGLAENLALTCEKWKDLYDRQRKLLESLQSRLNHYERMGFWARLRFAFLGD